MFGVFVFCACKPASVCREGVIAVRHSSLARGGKEGLTERNSRHFRLHVKKLFKNNSRCGHFQAYTCANTQKMDRVSLSLSF